MSPPGSGQPGSQYKQEKSMRPVIDNDFLLHSDAAKALYHQYAEKMPIIDYHCHIDPQDIAEDQIGRAHV